MITTHYKIHKKHKFDRLVVAFDICSSSNIIEDITKTGNLDRFNRLLKDSGFVHARETKLTSFERLQICR